MSTVAAENKVAARPLMAAKVCRLAVYEVPMTTEPKVPGAKSASKTVSLKGVQGVLKKNAAIKKNINTAAEDLGSVNDTLKQKKATVVVIKKAMQQNEEAEDIVAKAAEDLKQVNIKLSKEIAARIGVEVELSEMKSDLATVRDNLRLSQQTEKASRHSALTDALTGLPNRMSFDQALSHALLQAQRHNWSLAVLFIDVDKFKHINDTYGHDTGDKVLITVAKRLTAFVRNEDIVSRWGGDEFVCLLREIKLESDVIQLAAKLVDHIAEDFSLNELMLNIRISIGIAISPQHTESADLLLKYADRAMYVAKTTPLRIAIYKALS